MSFAKQHAASQSSMPRPATTNSRPSAVSNEVSDEAVTSSPDQQQDHGQEQIHQEYEPSHSAQDATLTSFRPFFTLIEDANTSKFYHPTVHYVFSDDDTSLITEAALRSLDQQQRPPHPPSKGRSAQDPSGKGKKKAVAEEIELSSSASHLYTGKLPPPIPEAQEHIIILDVEPTASSTAILPSDPHSASHPADPAPTSSPSSGPSPIHIPQQQQHQQQQHQQHPFPLPSHYKITSARSLSPTWQVLSTHLTPTPTFDSSLIPAPITQTTSPDSAPFPVMLRVEGTAGSPGMVNNNNANAAAAAAAATTTESRHRSALQGNSSVATGQQTLDQMVELFEKRMGELRKVVEASGYGAPAQVEHEGRQNEE
ncbi:hypothetical protein D8B26_004394 [Coccidioides posadasii str. Silveira]|uniref:Uncharacterized protein n=2 Tax=Coccidioides posadasii TaxID=199306 RepID=E9DC60_COCPS|nr:hypothetical protein CPC735_021170 [Coccidioides posadasii C735 delta SOWgp]EER23089.1 hypothetical protein CPC735_021170 [Coccidioides posadasii C735 delta SOWgp]EFW15785.1 conserved hypothetical protein [Coccidioides posadasii str. Silveira]QVM09736.1 hypothetical protein D8B26_004394 [Coccidioides posadasii str. Silveira]|eukprot:XP_003065234.1 hypothetical protein CPC735_021170 [Coccidioides posadasii C735 delta SOWgp]